MNANPTIVRAERTGWRDQKISERHRMWGFNCPAVDLDFLMVEYNLGKPVGVVEYKHSGAQQPNLLHPTYRAITELANLASLPFFIAFYHNEHWWFRITPVNKRAADVFTNNSNLTEREFVTVLYKMRSLVVENEVLVRLNNVKPHPQTPAQITPVERRVITARQRTTCRACGNAIEVGNTIVNDTARGWIHESCPAIAVTPSKSVSVSDIPF